MRDVFRLIVEWMGKVVFSMDSGGEELPKGLAVIEINGHVRHVGRVRRLPTGLYEVREDWASVPREEHVPVRLYGRGAVFGIRAATEKETANLERQRLFRQRPCAHCGLLGCSRKGTVAEHVHVGVATAKEAWCERWTTHDTQLLAPSIAKSNPNRVTCEECRELIRTWEGPPGGEHGFAVQLISAFIALGSHVSVPVGRTERIEEATERMRAAGAVLDGAALDVLVHGDPSHVRERFGTIDGFRDLAIQVRGMTGVDWLCEAAEEGV